MKKVSNTCMKDRRYMVKARNSCLFIMVCGLMSMVCFLVFLSEAEAAFTEKGGVRPMGMGGAFVALADDSSAIMFNPAGLGQIEKAEFAAAYDKLYAGLGDDNLGRGFISYAYPSQYYGTFAVNTALLHTPLYRETTITFGYGRSLGWACLGLNAKGLFVSFEENEYTEIDPLFSDGMSTNGVALDLGMLFKPSDSISFGLAALNINQPNMALGEDAEAKVPFTLQTGIALKLGNTVPTLDLTYRNKELGGKSDINLHLGMESWLADRKMALRAGANFYDLAVGASYVFNRGKNMEAQLDYAFQYPLVFKEDSISDTYGSHQFSLNVRFGGFTAVHPEETVEKTEWKDPGAEADDLMDEIMGCKTEGKYEEGVELCNKLLAMEFDGAFERKLKAQMLMGSMLARLGRYDEAVDSFQSAVNMAPRDASTHYGLGLVYKQYGDQTENKSWYNKAIIEFERTKMIDSDFENVSSELADLYRKSR